MTSTATRRSPMLLTPPPSIHDTFIYQWVPDIVLSQHKLLTTWDLAVVKWYILIYCCGTNRILYRWGSWFDWNAWMFSPPCYPISILQLTRLCFPCHRCPAPRKWVKIVFLIWQMGLWWFGVDLTNQPWEWPDFFRSSLLSSWKGLPCQTFVVSCPLGLCLWAGASWPWYETRFWPSSTFWYSLIFWPLSCCQGSGWNETKKY